MGMTMRVPVDEVEKESVKDVVERALKSDPKNAYSIFGLMVLEFDIKESDINGKPFSQWKKGLPTLYTKIKTSLEKLAEEGKVTKGKKGKAYVYWWTK